MALLSLGFFPLNYFGRYVSYLILNVYVYEVGPYFLFGVAVIAAWFVFGMFSKALICSRIKAIVLLNVPAFLVLVLELILYVSPAPMREFIFNYAIPNYDWVAWTVLEVRTFYLPPANLGARIAGMMPFLRFASMGFRIGLQLTIPFAFMVGSSYLGHFVAERLAGVIIKTWRSVRPK